MPLKSASLSVTAHRTTLLQIMKLILFFIIALVVPPLIIVSRNGNVMQYLPILISSIGFALLLFAFISLARKISIKFAVAAGVVLLTSAQMVRYLLGFLYDFSGRGFTPEFFSHINRVSLDVALQEYDHEAWLALVVFSILAYFTARLIKKQTDVTASLSFALLPLAGLLIYFSASASPELQLAQAYSRYTQPGQSTQDIPKEIVREQTNAVLQSIRLTQTLPIEKSSLIASLPEKPLNLILIYLESFNLSLTENTRYPGLTPRIDAFKKRYHNFDQIHSSGYVTVEGIANSQCGTLMNMEYANSSLVSRKGRLPDLPCLGDILNTAGYDQTYLGGAVLDFAGKGAFFRDHGYNRVWGWEHWKDAGFSQANSWGLADTDLFEQAFDTIQESHQKRAPFNITLLTLGTHTPGFVYDGCPVYTEEPGKPFINGIHCTDYLLGQLVDKLEKSGILEDTVLFMQADHGSFITPEILKQVGKKVGDTRLLTLLRTPDSIQISPDRLRANTAGTNLNTVATLLDLLKISHNTEFIFAKSHFEEIPEQSYFPTRRQDYLGTQRFDNNRYLCKESDRNALPSLPLDNCDKDRVMQAVYELNLSYSSSGADNRICELAAEISVEAESGKVKITWGNQNLSDQFYRRGIKRNKHHTQGIYAVVMDQHNTVTQTLFFETEEIDMLDMQDLYTRAVPGQHILLIRNIDDMTSLKPNIQEMWPKQLRNQSVIYGEFDGQRLVPEFVSTSTRPDSRFTPASCGSGAA